jgi:quinol monooxygenase YgiN
MIHMRLRIVSFRKGERKMMEALDSMRALARMNNGCTESRLSVDARDARTFYYEEDWASREDLEREILSERFTRLLAIVETASEKPVLEFNFVSETRGIHYIGEIRGGAPGLGEPRAASKP